LGCILAKDAKETTLNWLVRNTSTAQFLAAENTSVNLRSSPEEMSKSARGDRTYRRGGPASRRTLTICRRGGPSSTARSTTSVDTNVLLKRADDVGLDTSRSAVSVDTDVLLGDLASTRDLEEPRHVGETQAPLNSTYDKSTHLSLSMGTKATADFNVQAFISSLSTGTETAMNSISSQSSCLKKLSPGTREARISTHSASTRLTSSSSTGTEAKWNFTPQSTSLPSSSMGTKATTLNSTYINQPPASLTPSSSTDDMMPNEVGGRAHFHADRMSRMQLERSQVTARSVASADCAPVDYDDDVLINHRGSSGFEVSASDKRRPSEGPCPVSVSRNGSSSFEVSLSDEYRLSKVCRDRDRFRVSSFGFEVSALDKRRPSEGLCPVGVHRNGSFSSEVFVSKRQFSEVCPSRNNDRVGSFGFEVSALDKRYVSEGSGPVSTHHCGSSGFETAVLDQRRLSENDDSLGQVTARSDSSLDAAMMLRDSTFSPPVVDDVLPDSGTTSRTLASVDTNVLLQTTEDVVTAMEAARTNHHSHTASRDPSPPIRNNSVLSYENTDMNPYAMDDVHSDADYETETVDMGNTGMVLPQSSMLTKPPPAHGKTHAISATSYGRHGRHGTKEAWGNLRDYDIAGDIGTSSEKTYGGHKSVQVSQKRAMQGDSDSGSEYFGRPYTALRPEFDCRRYTGQLRCRSGVAAYPGQDSDRSLASSASLGEKIVARSRQNQRPAIGKSSRTSSNVTRKNARQQQHDRDLSPSGLVLEGCRVELRRTFSNSHERSDSRPTSAVTKRPVVSQARSAAATSVTGSGSASRLHQSGRSECRTSPGVGGGLRSKTQNGWTDDLSSLNDSLCTDGSEPAAPAPLSHQVR